MKENYNEESKKQVLLFFHTSLLQVHKKYRSLFLNTSFFFSLVPDYWINQITL